ncbi:MAG: GvpL/GvpF family gas vesicle protein [Chloroflexi bacterium]|nr:GvpL/GvpF family gas vesicle protein [Chloroflexota bacterium]
MASACYVYGIQSVECSPPSGLAGFAGSPVIAIRCRALIAAASLVDAKGVGPTPENLLLHEEVVEALQLAGPLLPARFGTVLPSDEAVVEALAERQAALLFALSRVGDRVELGLSVLRNPPGSDGEDSSVDRGATSFGDSTQMGVGARYLRAKLVAHRREASLRREAAALAQGIDGVLRRHAIESCYTVLPTPRLAMRAAYLVAPRQLGEFHKAFDELRVVHRDHRFLLSGPWPPYSFVSPPSALLQGEPVEKGASLLAAAASKLLWP